jgi:hypothetical protein
MEGPDSAIRSIYASVTAASSLRLWDKAAEAFSACQDRARSANSLTCIRFRGETMSIAMLVLQMLLLTLSASTSRA